LTLEPQQPPGEPDGEGEPGRPDGQRPQPGGRRPRAAPAPLEPLGENERPPALLIASGVCALLALAVLVGGLTIHDLSRHGGSLPGAIFLAGILGALAVGMYSRRYLAVLGFQALLTFQILATSLALVIATSLVTAAFCLLGILLAGWLFWKLIRVMGRIQAGEEARRTDLR
jgi:hypothetical protein